MTANELQDILASNKERTLSEIREILYQLKNDCIRGACDENPYKRGYYQGEVNAFYICLDLLEKLEDNDDHRRTT